MSGLPPARETGFPAATVLVDRVARPTTGGDWIRGMSTRALAPPRALLRSPIAVSMAGKLAEAVTLVGLAVLVPRVLGASGFGRFAIVLAVVQLVGASLTLGGSGMMARFVPAAAAAERSAIARALTMHLVRWRLVGVAAATLVLGLIAAVRPDLLHPGLAAAIAIAIALDVATTMLTQAGLGMGRTTLWSIRWPLENAVLVASALALWVLDGPEAAVGAVVVAAAVTVTVVSLVVVPDLRSARAGAPLPAGALRFGTLQGLSGLLGLVTARGPVLLVAVLAASHEEAGFAALAVGVALAVTFAVSQAFAVQLPDLASRVATDRGGAHTDARRLAWWATAVATPAAALAALWLHSLVPAVFGEAFRGAVPAFVVALALLPLAPVWGLAAQASSLRLRAGIRVGSNAMSAAVFLAVSLVTVPLWGAVGATLGLLAGTVAGIVLAGRLLRGALGRLEAVSLVCSALVLALGAWAA